MPSARSASQSEILRARLDTGRVPGAIKSFRPRHWQYDRRQIPRNRMRLAMAVADMRRCGLHETLLRHFEQTARIAGVPLDALQTVHLGTRRKAPARKLQLASSNALTSSPEIVENPKQNRTLASVASAQYSGDVVATPSSSMIVS